MNTTFVEARKHIAKAREALQRGDKEAAWQLGRQAALAAPDMEDAWLVLVASDPSPQDAVAYARKALEINHQSPRARRGLEWALARVRQNKLGNILVKQSTTLSLSPGPQSGLVGFPKRSNDGTIPGPQARTSGRKWFYSVLLMGAGLLVVGLLGLFVLTRPVLASIASAITAPVPTQEILWASADIAKPEAIPLDASVSGSEGAPLDDIISIPTDMPTLSAAAAPAVMPEATETPGTMVMEIVDVDSMSQSGPGDEEQTQYPAEGNGERWIDVNLSEQRVYVYEGDVVVNSFLVSTGVAETPTVTGKYKIYVKVRIQDMSGPGYYLRDVPWVMFFYDEYGFHGTYWHNNFGTPMSRGCVNMTIDDAAWLYNWASVGTVVNVHY